MSETDVTMRLVVAPLKRQQSRLTDLHARLLVVVYRRGEEEQITGVAGLDKAVAELGDDRCV